MTRGKIISKQISKTFPTVAGNRAYLIVVEDDDGQQWEADGIMAIYLGTHHDIDERGGWFRPISQFAA